MKLYLARHGDYLMDATKQLDVLTEKGIQQITKLGAFLKQADIHLSGIFHSGKHRAEQTAALLANDLLPNHAIQIYPGTQPNDDVVDFATELSQLHDDILVVGHLPFMGRLVSQLMIGNDSKDLINFQTGTLVCMESIDHGRWIIHWVLTPALFMSS